MADEFTAEDFGGGTAVADEFTPEDFEERQAAPEEFTADDFQTKPPDLSKIKPSPYEALDIASMERGQGKALTGMEPGTELTTALARGAARAFAAVPPTIQSIADFPSALAGSVGRAKGQTLDQPLVGAERAPQAQEFGQWLQRPLVEIPKLDTSPDTEGFERPGYEQVAREAVNVALSIPEFFESPLGLATMGIGASGKTGATLVRRAFLGDMMKNLVQQYPEMISNWPKMSQSQKIKAVVDLSATAAMAGGLAKPEMAKVSAPFEARTAPEGPVSPEFAPPVSREAPAPMVRAPQLPPMMVSPAPMTAPLPVSADRPEVTGDILAGRRMRVTPEQAAQIRAFQPRPVPTETGTTPPVTAETPAEVRSVSRVTGTRDFFNYLDAIKSNDPDALDFLESYNEWARRWVKAETERERTKLAFEAIERFGDYSNFAEQSWDTKVNAGFRWNRQTKRFEKPTATGTTPPVPVEKPTGATLKTGTQPLSGTQEPIYNAEDWAKYQDINRRIAAEPDPMKKAPLIGERETLKEKYGNAAPAQVTASPQDLIPALRTKEGQEIPGQKGGSHEDIYNAQGKPAELELKVSQPEHGFLWKGQFLSRRQAADLIGEKDELHSERLAELQKAKPEAPKPAAPPVETKPPAGATEPASPATPALVSATEPAAPAPEAKPPAAATVTTAAEPTSTKLVGMGGAAIGEVGTGEGSDIMGVRQATREQQAAAGLPVVDRPGQGISTDQSLIDGRAALAKDSAAAEQVHEEFGRTGRFNERDFGIARAKYEQVMEQGRRIEEQYGTDSPEVHQGSG